MRRIIAVFIILHSSFMALHSQSASELFVSMPDSLFPLLTEKNRNDMVDFYNNHMEAKVRNILDDYARLDTLTDSYLRLTLTKSSTAEMKLLETDDSMQVIVLIQTALGPARDSRVRFFNAQWQRLYWLELPAPQTPDFFSASPDSVAREMDFAQRSVDDMRLVEVTASPSEPLLTLNVAVDELAEEEKKVARRYVRPLRYRWTGSEFLRE